MCGIFGVIGADIQDAPQLVFRGLSDIEYRGYDSWGVAFPQDGSFKLLKKIGFLPKTISTPNSSLAVGHTRWATHGGVTDANAHPHSDCTGELIIVHNGIVENYLPLKKQLKGHLFKSETDSEVIVHLVEQQRKIYPSLKESVAAAFNKLQGLNAIVVSDGKHIVACKNSSPLVIGKAKAGYVIASDPNAILPLTNQLLFLEDNQLVVLNEKLELYSVQTLKSLPIRITEVDWQHTTSELKNYPHFMLKEMYEQPKVLRTIIQNIGNASKVAKLIKNAYGTYFIGCGSASYACIAGEYLFSTIAKKHVNFSVGSEFNYTEDFLTNKSLLIAVSQSGETIDVVEPVEKAKQKGTKIVSLTNTLGSTLYRMSDMALLLQAGPEKGVAATKTLIAMLANMILLAYCVNNTMDEGEQILQKSAKAVESVLKRKQSISRLATKIQSSKHIYILGRGLSYSVALETALKIKEISYIHAEGFAGGELKHGVIALVEKNTPVIVYVPEDETKDGILANAMEVKARGALIIGVGVEENPVFDFFFKVEDCGASSIIPHTVFAQLLGYYLAVKLGHNPDKPRNLAKSVVVR